jgi:SAM-dependent methyltransferase
MNHDEYIRMQVEEHGQVKKPLHYRRGQKRAIDEFFREVPQISRVLDLGCGDGTGVKHLNSIGFKDVVGIDLHPRKIALGRKMGLNVYQRDLYTCEFENFDIVWSSHSFEHMIDPEKALGRLCEMTEENAKFFFVMPYPDTAPANAHVASRTIGLDIDDEGETVMEWFWSSGMFRASTHKFDKYREPEIWIELWRKHG